MSDVTKLFERAQAGFGTLVHDVRDEQWSAPTPCSEWDVRALVNHLVYEARWVPPMLEGKSIAEVGDAYEGDLLGEDPATAYDDALAGALTAIDAPGALDASVHLSYGDTPAAGYVAQLTCDFVVHAWDLARGIGADDTLDPELVEFVYAEALPQADMLAASGLFDAPIAVPDDADTQTKLLALFGRNPSR